MGNTAIDNITFHNQRTSANTGTEFSVSKATLIELEIFGTATSHSITLEGRILNNWYPVGAVNIGDFSTTANGVITTKGSLWQVDLTGLTGFRVNLTAISGGNITVLGRAVL